ncbi:MAG TPA: FtsX-like permease family protein [Gammaproteobacteria bacterium]|nr:FtsX-like permease family protein [Gammaproteobacteria bacterium]
MKMYFKVALRTLRREKLYAALNVGGLALGLACCLILGLYLRVELTYDRHYANYDRIYRLAQRATIRDGTEFTDALTSSAHGPMLADEFPTVVLKYVRFSRFGGQQTKTLLRSDDRAYYWDHTYTADANVFEVFSQKILYGDPRTALAEPVTVAISREMAERYFGSENPVGRTLYNALGVPFKVTLVFENQPENTHLKYDALFAYQGIFAVPDDVNARRGMLNRLDTYTYVLVPEGYDPRSFEPLARRFYDEHMAATREAVSQWDFWLQPLADIHLHSTVDGDEPTGNPLYLYAFAAVALFILSVACINYVNLATARAAGRARSVALRKIVGASRASLVGQLLGESVLFALLATVLAVVAVEILVTLPPVTALFGKRLTLDVAGDPKLAAAIVCFGLMVGTAAGLYPAVYLSSFMPLAAFASRYHARGGGLRLRETLVFVQFALSVGVIAATLLMTAQMRYVANKALGFDAANRIVIPLRGADLIEQQQVIAAELEKNPGVLGVTTAQTVMGRDPLRRTQNELETDDGGTRQFLYDDLGNVGADFLPVMGLELVAGRDFSEEFATDVGGAAIVNETFVREMGWKEPLGKRIGSPQAIRSARVVGVVKDFHFRSLHERILPYAIFRGDGDFRERSAVQRQLAERLMIVNVARDGLRDTLRYINERFAAFDRDRPFEFTFLDADLDRLYVSENRLLTMIAVFAGICIFVACLGLFGLAAFTTEQRTKEIGVRKILGASALEIVRLLSGRVLLLIAAGGATACVVAWAVIARWLSGFAYRADIEPAYFALAVVGAAAVALGTIALQSWRTARANPVESLRCE